MIFVSVGTRHDGFDRLIKKLDELSGEGKIKEQIVAQIGNGKYIPSHLKAIKFCSPQEFDDFISQSRVVVSHAGVGVMMSAILKSKPVIALPRKASLNEMDDDLKAEALNSVGSIYYLREEYEEAINNLNQCIEVSDNDLLSASSQYQIGKIYFDLGQYVNAIENFNYVFDYDPPEEFEFNALMQKVNAQIKLEKIDLALKTLSQTTS